MSNSPRFSEYGLSCTASAISCQLLCCINLEPTTFPNVLCYCGTGFACKCKARCSEEESSRLGIWQSLLGHKPITAKNLRFLCLDNTVLRLASLCTAVRGAFLHIIQEHTPSHGLSFEPQLVPNKLFWFLAEQGFTFQLQLIFSFPFSAKSVNKD